jgi:GH24 family phage-related lysozyme (muramidase)
MPVNQLRPTNRAKAAIGAVVAAAIAGGGYVMLPGGQKVPPQVALAADTLIEPWESTQLRPYYDRIAKPPVWTVCAGDTKNVTPGVMETPAGCTKRLMGRLTREFYPALVKCIPGFDDKPIAWGAMMISLSWNIGWAGACNSTAARLGREGRYRESCDAATAFNKAGGQMIIGLVRRREMGDAQRIGEGELCVSGLK